MTVAAAQSPACATVLPHAPHGRGAGRCPGRPMKPSVPWHRGSVEAVAADLRASQGHGDRLEYASALGMIDSLARGDNRPPAERMADICTVLEAFELVRREQRERIAARHREQPAAQRPAPDTQTSV